jgi:hypothetical protein
MNHLPALLSSPYMSVQNPTLAGLSAMRVSHQPTKNSARQCSYLLPAKKNTLLELNNTNVEKNVFLKY